MTTKYKVGDRVKIQSLDWYNENKDNDHEIKFENGIFTILKSTYLGQIMTIEEITLEKQYILMEDRYKTLWTDEMIEGLVEEEDLIPKFGEYSDNEPLDVPKMTTEFIKEIGGLVEEETKPNIIEEAKTYWDSIKDAWICPEGYIFKDENGNVINATKIVLEKKKKEYPKTYEECCKEMNYCYNPVATKTTHKEELIRKFQFLLLYRDAYWKIAGEEMELGKPWVPDWSKNERKYTIEIKSDYAHRSMSWVDSCILAFPTEKMRDDFKKNFDKDIEFCKELL